MISPEDYKRVKDKVLTIDVRTKGEFEMLPHFEWAINIEFTDFIKNYEYYLEKYNPDNKLIITVCNAGNRSGQTASFLKEHGIDALTLQGGIYGYNKKFK
ncbi:rhodanese-like domain-containing protein [Spiroplasma turonicum]|uniref:Rhodanese domain-containing protein n=1 Tax=Spiroplasma turonicum TaxID=216946 RepID=A0A0K1P775_9MOLU|nr:rhodanese-like domain-containing protein [Spiroplasma turonicum]AKU80140.1 hypothetical protein STURON_00894 [Spiroplasma turonicum]ALX71140.1 hypothetical protein STURO_v1c08890 [Spiroplasma turonicum]